MDNDALHIQTEPEDLKTFISRLDIRLLEYSQLIEKAWCFAKRYHKGQYRESGEEYFRHCMEVAIILRDLNMDAYTICAGLLHDTVEDTNIQLEDLEQEFNLEIAKLVDGVTKISNLKFSNKFEQRVENLRKMILAMAKDIRVIIIKLADRLNNMRTLNYLPMERQQRFALETREIYVPFANRLGMGKIKGELEDLIMSFLEPEIYYEIQEKIAMDQIARDQYVQSTIEILKSEIDQYDIPVIVKGRPKSIYSIYLKMKKRQAQFEEIYDQLGLRVITNTVEQCYSLVGIIHKLWRPVPNLFKDYVAVPKKNGYQSLHTTVVGPQGRLIEIQIRTKEMDRVSEEGIAAHWKYKEGKKGNHYLDDKLIWLRKIVDWIQDFDEPGDLIDALQADIFEDSILCFTPKGDVIELPKGSTPLDFAYYIHTEVGNTCVGAKVQNKMVSLRYTLKNYDIVEIIRSKNAHPNRDWLDIAQTNRARNKIRIYLKNQNYDVHYNIGKDLFNKALRKKGIDTSILDDKKVAHLIINRFNANSLNELFVDIGFKKPTVARLSSKLESVFQSIAQPQSPKKFNTRIATPRVKVDGMDNIMVRYAKCCNPLPGDEVVGFITRGRGISIHKKSCPSLEYHLRNEKEKRWIEVTWEGIGENNNIIKLDIISYARKNVYMEITSLIQQGGAIIYESKYQMQPDQTIKLQFTLNLEDKKHEEQLMRSIKKKREILRISRR